MKNEIVIGLDLANQVGISVVDGNNAQVLYSDSFSLAKGDTQKRLLRLHEVLHEVIDKYQPAEMAIEDVFLPARTSPKTPIALGELRGVARLAASEHAIPVFFYAPRKVKMAITGYGNASKEDIVSWIETEFKLSVKDDNEADAISIAWTHILTRRFDPARM